MIIKLFEEFYSEYYSSIDGNIWDYIEDNRVKLTQFDLDFIKKVCEGYIDIKKIQ